MKFFFDTSISKKICQAIELLDDQDDTFLHLDDKFDSNVPDHTWLVWAKKEGYVVISGDKNIRETKNQRELLIKLGLMSFFYAKRLDNLNFWKQASILIAAYPEIRRFTREDGDNKIFEITTEGKVIPK